MKKIIGYTRVSTKGQADSGLSLEAQRLKIQQYAELYDLELVGIIEDAGHSAKTLDRPGLVELLGALKAGKADGVIICKLDRLTRSVSDMATLIDNHFGEKSNHSLMSVGDNIDTRTAAGRLMLNVLVSVAQWEAETTSERTSLALKAKRARGEFAGGRLAYGQKNQGGKIVANPDEQRVYTEAKRLKKAGLSLRTIATELEKSGFVNRRGCTFHPNQIRRFVAQEK